MKAALRVVRYIKEAPGLGLLMPAESTNKLAAYCDSDWGSCIESRRSIIGYLVKFGNAVVSWKAKKQVTMSRSSAEAEFRSMASCATTKHIDIDCHFVREKICQGLLKTECVHTKDQLADLLTKSLGKFQHDHLLNKLGVKNVYQPSV
ncbi:secreted RxLR effector protein 161-like [Nicotiana tomentosiformis]|uniref:secreted RxLR effector protein 161-like n=1 Tax=Nicotiana tomentosiformis TaxID=4098 RepID=UPI00388CA8B9